jgi:hypothetical protein
MTDTSSIDNLTFGEIKTIAEEMGKLASLFHTGDIDTKVKNNPTFNNSNTINLALRDGELSHVESTTPIIQAGKVGKVNAGKTATKNKKAEKKTRKQILDENAWYNDPEYVLGRIGVYHGNYANAARYCDKEVVMINLTGHGKMACYVVDTKRIAMLDPELLTDTGEKVRISIAPDATDPAPQPTRQEEDKSGADNEPMQLELNFDGAADKAKDNKAPATQPQHKQASTHAATQTAKETAQNAAKKTAKKVVKQAKEKQKATQAPTPKDMPKKKPDTASKVATPSIDFDSADESLTGINKRILERKLKRMEERGEI